MRRVGEALLDAVPGGAVLGLFGAEPPDAGIADGFRRPPGEFARERGFADAAQAMHGGGLGDGGFGAARERAGDGVEFGFAAGEIGGWFDPGVEDGLGRLEEVRDGRERVFLPARAHRGEDHIAQHILLARLKEPYEIPEGQRFQQANRIAGPDAQNDELGLPVERIVRDGVLPFRRAMIAVEIVLRQQRDGARAGCERRVHAVHEGAVLDVPILDDDRPARILQNMRDALRDFRVGTGPADEKLWRWRPRARPVIRMCFANRHRRPIKIKKLTPSVFIQRKSSRCRALESPSRTAPGENLNLRERAAEATYGAVYL